MIVLALIVVGAIGAAAAAWGLGRGRRAARIGAVAGVLALVIVLVVALAMDAPRVGSQPVADGVAAFNGRLVPNDYLRLVIGLWGLDAVLLVAIAWLLGGLAGLRGLLPATLAAIVGGIVAFAATDLTLGAVAAGTAGLAALAVLLVGRDAVTAAAREMRVAIAGTAVLVAVTAAAPAAAALVLGTQGPIPGAGAAPSGVPAAGAPTEAGAVVGLLALSVAAVVALRLGVIPFHLRVPRLTDVAPPISLPLLLAWIPVPLGVAAIAISDQLIAPLALPLDGERTIIVLVALSTLVAGALAAFMQDDLRHAVGYLVIADAGIVVLGFAALDPAAWGPTRVWLVAMAASKTAVAAWAAVMEDRFATRSVPDLRGWLRHSPILAAALVVAALATYGLPGWVAFEARGDLARLASPDFAWLIVLAGVATLPTYVRLIAVGTGPATSRVRGAAPERWAKRRRQETLPVTVEGAPSSGAGAVDVTGAAGKATTRSPRLAARPRALAGSVGQTAGRRVVSALRRDRTELLAAAVLALAILAGLTSWGALDLGSAASEAAPTVPGPSAD